MKSRRRAPRRPPGERANVSRDLFERVITRRTLPAVAHVDTMGVVERLSFAELARRAARWSWLLRAHGIRNGDRVVIAAGRRPEWLAAVLGAINGGAVAVPLREGATPQDMAAVATHCEAALVVGPFALVGDEDELAGVAVLRTDDIQGDLADQPTAAPTYDTVVGDVALILYERDADGELRGAAHTHGSVIAQADAAEVWLEAEAGDRLWASAEAGSAESVWAAIAAWSAAAELIVTEVDPPAHDAVRLIELLGIGLLWQTPGRYAELAQIEWPRWVDAPRIRAAVSSTPVDEELVEAFAASYGARIRAGYLRPETGLLAGELSDGRRRPGTLGVALPGREVVAVDGRGQEPEAGEPGELAVRAGTAGVFAGWWSAREQRPGLARGGWHRLGEPAAIDVDGFLRPATADEAARVASARIDAAADERRRADEARAAEAARVAAEQKAAERARLDEKQRRQAEKEHAREEEQQRREAEKSEKARLRAEEQERKAEERRQSELRKKAELEQKRLAKDQAEAEARQSKQEAAAAAAAAKLEAAERKRQEAVERERAESEERARRQQQEEARRRAEAEQRAAEEERRRLEILERDRAVAAAEEQRRAAEAAERKRQEETRLAAEQREREEALALERARALADKNRREQAEARKHAEEAARLLEESKQRDELARKRRELAAADAERRRAEEAEAAKQAAAATALLEESRRRDEEERRRREIEAAEHERRRAEEAERQRAAAERAEQERRRAAAERAEEERKRAEEAHRRRAAAEQHRREEERRRQIKADEARREQERAAREQPAPEGSAAPAAPEPEPEQDAPNPSLIARIGAYTATPDKRRPDQQQPPEQPSPAERPAERNGTDDAA